MFNVFFEPGRPKGLFPVFFALNSCQKADKSVHYPQSRAAVRFQSKGLVFETIPLYILDFLFLNVDVWERLLLRSHIPQKGTSRSKIMPEKAYF
ncbi:MAG TPA: hypothetical protein DCS07_12930 [Bdellovibrionales bacterium]|nr:MAG: hypothetical protein A2Z97_14715 [Bdellovibrionales bacterium GWB1_52_6]OFZ02599.1 MAG: hypothetical protein A2X97_08055 [Bdellovibrionales bacterium GWA1_52_35]OFZ41793.1 MAG: hypothetical protein A2070_09335 [Bdellovibrionales bacterium GWC1_52_8]HAR43511.1 hypothetical protein [Bdellovibrionales bacterium]